MNIKEAKQQIKNAIIAYSTKNEYGKHLIPVSKQRPIFLIGAPGIGKTAIMEQIASELDIALVSYSMTHHTRQSALGLPFIVDKKYGDEDYKVTEYTMSEIIASVYDAMEQTGKSSGILFLDEINCISETLAPSMLQFLQYKTFGRHKVPDDWIVVTAGNPAEYNSSVREYDIAIWDRLKKIEVTADYETWKEFAINHGVHPVVTSYLNIKPSNFYSITSTVDGKSFVTARGWDDLSQMIILYEKNDIAVDENLIGQYLQDEKIAKDFGHYYQLFHKYQSDYKVEAILDGGDTTEIKERCLNAKFDEHLSFISLVMSSLDDLITPVVYFETALRRVMKELKALKGLDKEGYLKGLKQINHNYRQELKHKEDANSLSKEELETTHQAMRLVEKLVDAIELSEQNAADVLKHKLNTYITNLQTSNDKCQNAINNIFTFFESVFNNGQEMLILVTEMTLHNTVSKYIYMHGNDAYYKHNKQLLFKDKQDELMSKIDAINLLSLEENEQD